MFQKAVKQEAKLRLAIAGVSGGGKTFTALTIAQTLSGGGKVAVVDTEHGSASKYADQFDFDVMNIEPPFHPKRFLEAIKEAEQAGYSVVILDSLSHAWNGTGGILDIVDQAATRLKGNSYAAWKEGTPIYNDLIDGIIRSDVHVIATMRSKQEYAQSTDESGKKKVEKLGMSPIQRDGFEYEFDVVFNMDSDNTAIVTKTRCPALANSVIRKPNREVAEILTNWLHGVKREAMTLEQAQSVKSPGGAELGTLGADKLNVLISSHAQNVTNEMREAAKILVSNLQEA